MTSAAKRRGRGGRPRGVTLDGQVLKSRRRKLGLTQVEAADLSTVTTRTVQAAERGRPISVSSARRLGTALGVSYAALIQPAGEALDARLIERGYAPAAPPKPFTGRGEAASRLIDLLKRPEPGRLACISGPSGIGKTVLARYVAAAVSDRFSGGVVWIVAPRGPAERDIPRLQIDVAGSLGFNQRLPNRALVDDLAFDRAFHTLLWSHRRLVILDDAARLDEVERLLGHTIGHALMTTTRRGLARSVKALRIELGPLSLDDGLSLLGHYLGEARLSADREGGRALVDTLAGVPRSLRIAGRLLQRETYTRPRDYLQRLVAAREPAEADVRVATWGDTGDPDASFVGSQVELRRRVSQESWSMFASLSGFDDQPFSLRRAARAAGMTESDAAVCLSELVDLYLVHEDASRLREASSNRPLKRRFHLDSHSCRVARWSAGSGLTGPGGPGPPRTG